MNISGFACQGIKRIYHTARVLHHSLKPAPNQINRQNRKYIHKNYYLPEAGHYIVPILVKPLYTIICKLIQALVLPLYIKTVIGSHFYLFFMPPAGAARTAATCLGFGRLAKAWFCSSGRVSLRSL